MEISFSDRLANIVELTEALSKSNGDAMKARDEARALEANLYSRATSKEDYEGLCQGLIMVKSSMLAQVPTDNFPEVIDEVDEEENVDDIKFDLNGPHFQGYKEATVHRVGQMSIIFMAKAFNSDESYKVVALKVTTPSAMQPPHNSAREARLLVEARHEHVVRLIESFPQSGGRLVLAFPFLRQDLEVGLKLGFGSGKQKIRMVKQFFSALQHIHSLGIIHRDVKPSNLLLGRGGHLYLADFGIAWSPTDAESEAAHNKITDVGTTRYRPPELLFGCRDYDASLDMWAAGCVVAEIVHQDHEKLFDAGPLGSELGLIKSMFATLGTPTDETWPSAEKYPDWGKMRFQKFPGKDWHEIIPGTDMDAVDLVRKLVDYEGTRRLTAEEALQHSFVLEQGLLPILR